MIQTLLGDLAEALAFWVLMPGGCGFAVHFPWLYVVEASPEYYMLWEKKGRAAREKQASGRWPATQSSDLHNS